MVGFYYFCCMQLSSIITYFINNISELKTPVLSLDSCIFIGSSDSDPSISDCIEKKSKSVGKLISLSISQSPLPNAKNQVNAMFRKTTFDLIMFDKWVGVNCTREKVTEVQLMKCK